jgi:hypothetical protein
MLEKIVQQLPSITSAGLGVFVTVWYFCVIEPKQRAALESLANAINSDKQYTMKDFAYFSPVSVENTILRINRRLDLIIDRNSITDNILQIEEDIQVLIDREVEDGRKYLRAGNFQDGILPRFFHTTDAMKQNSISKLKVCFVEAAHELGKIDNEKEEFRATVRDCDESWRDILDRYDDYENRKKKQYTKLKREIWTVFETTIYNVQQSFIKIGG